MNVCPDMFMENSLLYLLAYYPPPKYNNGKHNYVNVIFIHFVHKVASVPPEVYKFIIE